MNEEFISKTYELAKSKGYNGAIEDFKSKISSDNEFISMSHKLVSSYGYGGSVEDFNKQLGIQDIKVDSDTPEASFTNGSIEQQKQPIEPLNQSLVKIKTPLIPTPLAMEAKPESTIGLDKLKIDDEELKSLANKDEKKISKPLEPSKENIEIFKKSWDISKEKNKSYAKKLVENNASIINDSEESLVAQMEEKFGYLNSDKRSSLIQELKGVDFSSPFSSSKLFGSNSERGAFQRYFPQAFGNEFKEEYVLLDEESKKLGVVLSQEQKDILKRAKLFSDYPEAKERAILSSRSQEASPETKLALVLNSPFKEFNSISKEIIEDNPNFRSTISPFINEKKRQLISEIDNELSKIKIDEYTGKQTSGFMTGEDQTRNILDVDKSSSLINSIYEKTIGDSYNPESDSDKLAMTEIKLYVQSQLRDKIRSKEVFNEASTYPEFKRINDESKKAFEQEFSTYSTSLKEVNNRLADTEIKMQESFNESLDLKLNDLKSTAESIGSSIEKRYQSGEIDRVEYEKSIGELNKKFLEQQDSIVKSINDEFASSFSSTRDSIMNEYSGKIESEMKKYSSTYKTPEELSRRMQSIIGVAAKNLNQKLLNAEDSRYGLLASHNALLLSANSFKSFVNSFGRQIQGFGLLSKNEDLYDIGGKLSDAWSVGVLEEYKGDSDLEYIKSVFNPKNVSNSFGNLLGSASVGIAASIPAAMVGGRIAGALAPSRFKAPASVVGGLVTGGLAGFSVETIDMMAQVRKEALESGLSSTEADNRADEMLKSQLGNVWMYSLDALPFVGKALSFIPNKALRVVVGANVEGVTETGQEIVQTAQEESIRTTGYASGWDRELRNSINTTGFFNNEMVKATIKEVLPGAMLMGGLSSTASQIKESVSEGRMASEAFATMSMMSEEGSASILSQKILKSVQSNGKNFTKAWVSSLAGREGVTSEAVDKLLLEVDDASEFASKNNNLSKFEQLVYRTLQSQYRYYEDKISQLGSESSTEKEELNNKRKAALKNVEAFVNNPKTNGEYAIVKVGKQEPVVMNYDQFVEYTSQDEVKAMIKDGDKKVISISFSEEMYDRQASEQLESRKKRNAAVKRYRSIIEKAIEEEKAKAEADKNQMIRDAVDEAITPAMINFATIDIQDQLDELEREMNNAEYINDNKIDGVLENIFSKIEEVSNSSDESNKLKLNIINGLFEIAEKLDNYEFRAKSVSSRSINDAATEANEKTKGQGRSSSRTFEKTEVEINGITGFTITSIGDGQVSVSRKGKKNYGKVTKLSFAENFLYEDENGNFSLLVMVDEEGNEVAIRDENVAIPLALGELERTAPEVTTEELIEEIKYVKEQTKKAESKPKAKEQSDSEAVEEAKEVDKLRAEEQSEMLKEIPSAKDALTDGKVDREKLTTNEDKAKFDEIYDKYDKLISPLLKVIDGKETEEVKDLKSKTKENEKSNESKPKSGNRLFNEPLKEVKEIADRYYERVFGKKRKEFKGTRSLDKNRAKKISDAFEAMADNPENKDVKAAYSQLAKEIIEQYKSFIDAGYYVEINNEEPYGNSEEMIEDLRKNKRIKIFSTESGYGDSAITDSQRKRNPLLSVSEFVDSNGQKLLVNDLFRAIHDFFGHAELGNGFGAKGEENAWNVHARMFSPLARRAMTTETRGQNSYVNFSGLNEKAEALRDKARKMRSDGASNSEVQSVVDEIYELTSFAEQKIGLLPEQFSVLDDEESFDLLLNKKNKSQLDNARKAIGSAFPDLKIIVSESEEAYAKVAGESVGETSAGYYDRNGNIYINPLKVKDTTIGHEAFHAILLEGGMSDAEAKSITSKMLSAVNKVASPKIKKRIDDFSKNYGENLQSEEAIAELFGILTDFYSETSSEGKSIIRRWLDRLAKALGIGKIFKNNLSILDESDRDIINFLNIVSKKVATGEKVITNDLAPIKNVGGKTKSESSTRNQKSETRDSSWDENAKKNLPDSKIRSKFIFQDMIELGKWGLLTGENPENVQLTDAENKKENERAESWLRNYGYKPIPIFGKYDNSENSFFVENITRYDAAEFAREFNQESVATNEGLVYQDGTMRPINKGKEVFNSKEDNNYSVININGENLPFKIDYDLDRLVNTIPEGIEKKLTDDGKGNYVFYHYSSEPRSVLKPKSGDARNFTSKEEVAALSSVGGAVMFYTDINVKESGVGSFMHTFKVPKDKVYYLHSDSAGFYNEAKRLFEKARPGQGFSDNYQAAWISKVMKDAGYKILIAEWMGDKLRGQVNEEVVPDKVDSGRKQVTSDPSVEEIRKLKLKNKLSGEEIRQYLKNLGMSFDEITSLLKDYRDKYIKEDLVFTNDSGNKLINGIEKARRGFLSNKKFKPKSFQVLGESGAASLDYHAKQTEMNGRKLLQAIESNPASGKALEDIIKNVDLYLRGEAFDINGDPLITDPKILDAVQNMRSHLDILSEKLIDSGLIKAEESVLNIIDNLGSYLNRSFQVFDDKDWVKNNVTDSMILKAKLRLISDIRDLNNNSQYIEMLRSKIDNSLEVSAGSEYINRLEKVVNNEIDRLLSGKDDGPLFSFNKEGAVDTSVLMEKNKEIPKEILELLGEYVDPLLNYTRSAYKIVSILTEKEYLRNLVASGDGVWLFKEDDANRPAEFNTKIIKDGDRGRSELSGYFTTKEIAAELNGNVIINSLKESVPYAFSIAQSVYAGYLKAVGSVKYSKTILSIGTHAKNVIGNAYFMAQNGYLSPKAYNEAFSIIKESFSSKTTSMSELYSDIVKSGLLDQGQMRELRSIFSDSDSFESAIAKLQKKRNNSMDRGIKKLANKGKTGLQKGASFAQKLYQSEDDFFKVVAFQIERERYAEALHKKEFKDLNQEQKEEVLGKITEIVKNILPNYSRLGDLAKLTRLLPVAATFISFELESYRTAWNTVALAMKEIKDPKTRSIGVKRLSALSVTNASKYAGISVFGSAVVAGLKGRDDDEENWLESKYKYARDYVYPWSKNSQIVVLEVSDGKMAYLDLSASDPQGSMYELINSAMLSDSPSEALINSAEQLMSPYLSSDILLSSLTEISKEAFNPDISFENKIGIAVDNLYKAFKPGSIASASKIMESETPGIEAFGQFTGYKPHVIDVDKSFSIYKIREINDRLSDNYKRYNSLTYKYKDGLITKEDLESSYQDASEMQQKILTEASGLYNSALKLTANESKMKEGIGKVVRDKRLKNQIISGDIKPMKRSSRDPKSSSNSSGSSLKTKPLITKSLKSRPMETRPLKTMNK